MRIEEMVASRKYSAGVPASHGECYLLLLIANTLLFTPHHKPWWGETVATTSIIVTELVRVGRNSLVKNARGAEWRTHCSALRVEELPQSHTAAEILPWDVQSETHHVFVCVLLHLSRYPMDGKHACISMTLMLSLPEEPGLCSVSTLYHYPKTDVSKPASDSGHWTLQGFSECLTCDWELLTSYFMDMTFINIVGDHFLCGSIYFPQKATMDETDRWYNTMRH